MRWVIITFLISKFRVPSFICMYILNIDCQSFFAAAPISVIYFSVENIYFSMKKYIETLVALKQLEI